MRNSSDLAWGCFEIAPSYPSTDSAGSLERDRSPSCPRSSLSSSAGILAALCRRLSGRQLHHWLLPAGFCKEPSWGSASEPWLLSRGEIRIAFLLGSWRGSAAARYRRHFWVCSWNFIASDDSLCFWLLRLSSWSQNISSAWSSHYTTLGRNSNVNRFELACLWCSAASV